MINNIGIYAYNADLKSKILNHKFKIYMAVLYPKALLLANKKHPSK